MSVARGLWFAVVLGTGCDRVFGLETREPDASLPIDASVDDASFDASLALCPPSYAAVVGGETRYRFITALTTWDVAQADCADDTPTSITHLVELDSLVELAAMHRVFPGPPDWRAWTGYARDAGAEPYVFHATTGPLLPLGAPLWAMGEPDNSTISGEETVTFIFDDSRVVDGPPTFLLPAICECDGRPVTRTFTVLPTDNQLVAPK